MNRIECKTAQRPDEIGDAYRVRARVFVVEQGVPAEMELDEFDADAVHVVAKDNGRVIGTGRLVIENNKGRVGRMAVEKEYRGQGVGNALMVKLEEEARKRNLGEIYLHAQVQAQDFYTKLGYISRGEVFDEAGIEHQEMYKKI